MSPHRGHDRRDKGTRAPGMAYAGRWSLLWAMALLGGGVLATLLLVAPAIGGQTGGLFDWLFPGKGPQHTNAPPSPGDGPLATVRLRVEGLVCYGWPLSVKWALERLDGVVKADVSFEEKAATVQYDPSKVSPEQMIAAITRIGFRASLQKTSGERRFQGQGTVVAIDLQKGTVTLDHGEIKGLMPPMVMEFVVDSREALQSLQPGDTVTFTLRPRGVAVTIAEMTVVKRWSYRLLNAIFHAGVYTWLGLYFARRYGLGEIGIDPATGGASAAALALHLPVMAAALLVSALSLGYAMKQPLLAGIVTDLGGRRGGQVMGLNVFKLFVGFGLGSVLFGEALRLGFGVALALFTAVQLGAAMAAISLFRAEISRLSHTGSLMLAGCTCWCAKQLATPTAFEAHPERGVAPAVLRHDLLNHRMRTTASGKTLGASEILS